MESTAPSVFDKVVHLTLIDRLGGRHPVRAMEGQSLVEVLQDNEDMLGADCLCISPEGRGQNESHITLPNEYLSRFPAPDQRTLEDVASRITPNSRLASQIIISKDMEDLGIALAENAPYATP
ncbi:hypothetical protein WJX84_003523 [Apatococcus fuscideae]|uniref:Uncharacterized protein n=1 Tax=Apatococcus fuscideae TaxID=2026836 RepID=A0AAW1SQ32_9CHLO